MFHEQLEVEEARKARTLSRLINPYAYSNAGSDRVVNDVRFYAPSASSST